MFGVLVPVEDTLQLGEGGRVLLALLLSVGIGVIIVDDTSTAHDADQQTEQNRDEGRGEEEYEVVGNVESGEEADCRKCEILIGPSWGTPEVLHDTDIHLAWC